MNRFASQSEPALLLGCNVSNCLAAVRALGRKGIPLAVAGVRGGLVSKSRWFKPWPTEAEPRPETLTQALSAAEIPAGVLIPCTDHWVRAVASLPTAGRFRWSSPSHRAAETCLDKGQFAKALERLDLPRPNTLIPESGPLPAWSELTGYFVKPRDSSAFFARFASKGFRFSSAEEAEKVIRLCSESRLEILLQEFIPGPPTAHHFLDGFMDRHGRIRALFARRRVRAQYGELSNSSCLVSIDIEPMRDAAENLERFLRDIGYRGMFSAEFKLDRRDGRLKFIEVNTRVWGDMGLALRCGVDVVQMAYKDALGEDVQPVLDYKVGQHWINLHRDRVVARDLIRDRQLTWGAFGRSWMRASFDLLSLSDPGPALWDLGQRLRRRAGTEPAQLGGRRAQQHVGAL